MARFAIQRTNIALPDERGMAGASALLFQALDGFGKDDRASWRRFWKRAVSMEPGEMFEVEMVFPRSGPFHRRHMALEQSVFDAQERFEDFEQLRCWMKIGAAWVTWMPGPEGLVPIPKSISYAAADQDEFEKYHRAVVDFLRGPHAAPVLWPHLKNPSDMMGAILRGFDL
ncbi:MAG: hypothetical protein ACRCTG_16860 [Aestuariivirga sp.]